MNSERYRLELHTLINAAARDLSAREILAGLIHQTAKILVLSASQHGSSLDSLVEITRGSLDLEVVNYRKYHNAKSPS